MEVPLLYCSLYPVMGPLWCRQGTVPHITVSDLLSTDVLVSPTGAPVGAVEETVARHFHVLCYLFIPADVVLVEEVTSLLKVIKNVASTLTLQLLPGAADNM